MTVEESVREKLEKIISLLDPNDSTPFSLESRAKAARNFAVYALEDMDEAKSDDNK